MNDFKKLLEEQSVRKRASQHKLSVRPVKSSRRYGPPNYSEVLWLQRNNDKNFLIQEWYVPRIVIYKPPSMFDPFGWKCEGEPDLRAFRRDKELLIPPVHRRSKENLSRNEWFIFKGGLSYPKHVKLYMPWEDLGIIESEHVRSKGYQIIKTTVYQSKTYPTILLFDVKNQKIEEDTVKKAEVMHLLTQKYKIRATIERLQEKEYEVINQIDDKDPDGLLESMLNDMKTRLEDSLAQEEN